MTTTWHADGALLALYAADELDDAGAYSVEAHLMTCETCRTALAPAVDAARLDGMWAEVADRVDAPRPGIVERGLIRLGVQEHAARLLAATPSLRLSWFAAEALVLGSAVFTADRAVGGPRADLATLLFLMTAAILPVAGVAVAFGPRVDPTYEIGTAAPMRGYRLLLVRATAVLVTSLVLTSAAALALPGPGWTAVAWLVPSLGLTLGTLALATYLRPLRAAAGVAVTWASVGWISGALPADALAVFRPAGQFAFVLVIAVSVSVLTHRRETFEEGIVI